MPTADGGLVREEIPPSEDVELTLPQGMTEVPQPWVDNLIHVFSSAPKFMRKREMTRMFSCSGLSTIAAVVYLLLLRFLPKLDHEGPGFQILCHHNLAKMVMMILRIIPLYLQ